MARIEKHSFARTWLLRACVALPLLMLGANVLAWLRWGTDLPFLDDWRVYDQRNALSLDPARLFRAVNNTLAPIGLGLDAWAQRWRGGNALAYQTLSMLGVLGGLLWLQWRLLGQVCGNRLQQAGLFAFCIPMLQSGSYWGEQSLAYHQALPLLPLLGAMGLVLAPQDGGRGQRGWIFLLGLLAGLSYISGAVAALVLGACWIMLAWGMRGHERPALLARVRAAGWALGLAGALTSGLQLYLTRNPARIDGVQQYLGVTWPDRSDFWAYLLGKIGRGTGHGFHSVALELGWAAGVCLIWGGALAWVLRRGLTRPAPSSARWRRLALVLLPLSAVVFSYLAIVSMGRAGFRDPAIRGAVQVFQFSYERFHFFWVTLLFPWLAAVLFLGWRRRPHAMPALVGALLVLALLGWARGVFDVQTHYRQAAQARARDLACLQRQLGSGEPIDCLDLAWMGIPDLTRAYIHARDIHASFVRYLPIVARQGFGQTLLHWSGTADFERASWRNAVLLRDGWFRGEGDVQWLVPVPASPAAQGLDRCRTLGVRLTLLTRAQETTEIFFRPRGAAAYTQAQSARQAHAPWGDGTVSMEFSIDSPVGFEPQLRIDPVSGQGLFKWLDLQVTCRLWDRP